MQPARRQSTGHTRPRRLQATTRPRSALPRRPRSAKAAGFVLPHGSVSAGNNLATVRALVGHMRSQRRQLRDSVTSHHSTEIGHQDDGHGTRGTSSASGKASASRRRSSQAASTNVAGIVAPKAAITRALRRPQSAVARLRAMRGEAVPQDAAQGSTDPRDAWGTRRNSELRRRVASGSGARAVTATRQRPPSAPLPAPTSRRAAVPTPAGSCGLFVPTTAPVAVVPSHLEDRVEYQPRRREHARTFHQRSTNGMEARASVPRPASHTGVSSSRQGRVASHRPRPSSASAGVQRVAVAAFTPPQAQVSRQVGSPQADTGTQAHVSRQVGSTQADTGAQKRRQQLKMREPAMLREEPSIHLLRPARGVTGKPSASSARKKRAVIVATARRAQWHHQQVEDIIASVQGGLSGALRARYALSKEVQVCQRSRLLASRRHSSPSHIHVATSVVRLIPQRLRLTRAPAIMRKYRRLRSLNYRKLAWAKWQVRVPPPSPPPTLRFPTCRC